MTTAKAHARQRAKGAAPDRAVIYIRQSIAKEETISLEDQEHACREYCRERGYEVVRVVSEQITGRVWSRRKGVQAAMTMIDNGEADVIVVRKWARFSRRRIHLAIAEDRVERAGGRIESALEPTDATANGKLSRGVLLEIAEWESTTRGEEWKAAHDYRRRHGLPPSAGPRYGYTRVREGGAGSPEKYVPNPETAPTLVWMYEQYNAGLGHFGIAKALNKKGIPSPARRGRMWSQPVVASVLDSGFAAGLIAVGRAAGDSRSPQWIPWDDREWTQGEQDPVIDMATWMTYQRARTARQVDPPRTRAPAHPLAGIAICADCGGAMHRRQYKKRGHARLVCRAAVHGGGRVRWVTIAEHLAHEQVLGWLEEYAREIEAAAAAGHVAPAPTPGHTAAVAADRRIAEIAQELDRLTRHLIAARIEEAEYDSIRRDLVAERGRLQEIVEHAEVEAGPTRPAPSVVRGLIEEWHTLPPLNRREILRALADAVIVVPPEVPRGRATIRVVPRWMPAVR